MVEMGGDDEYRRVWRWLGHWYVFPFFSSLALTNGFEIYLGYIDVLYGQGGLGWASTALFSPSHHCLVFTITTHFFTSASVYATIVFFSHHHCPFIHHRHPF